MSAEYSYGIIIIQHWLNVSFCHNLDITGKQMYFTSLWNLNISHSMIMIENFCVEIHWDTYVSENQM